MRSSFLRRAAPRGVSTFKGLAAEPARRHARMLALAAQASLLSASALALAAVIAAPAQAAQAGQTAAATKRFDIPAGPLSRVINQFAVEAGVQVSVEAAMTANLNSPGLKGPHSVESGFASLLAGTGLEAVNRGGGEYTLRQLPKTGGVATLGAVMVAGTYDGSVTEGTGSYTTQASSTAMKLNLSLRDTPQTVTVVTRQKMDDFGLTNIDDVLESTSTISSARSGHNGNIYYSRGFMLQSQYDGLPNPVGIGENNRGPKVDASFLDKVEILQGASGLMAGAGEPGGTINLVRKRPSRDFQAHLETQLGSWDKKRLVGDISGPLMESGKVRGRAVAFVDHSDSFTDYVYYNNKGFYGVIEADVTNTTTLGASVMYQQTDLNDHYGVPFGPDGTDLGLPRSSYFGPANADSTRDSATYTLNLEQKLPGDWSFKTSFTHTDANVDKVAHNLLGTLDTTSGDGLSVSAARTQRKFSSNVLDLYASGPFQLAGRKHELVFGGTGTWLKDKNRNWGRTPTSFNIYDFDARAIPRPFGTAPEWPADNETNQIGVYGAARLELADSLKLVLGTRVSWYEYKAAGVRTQKEDTVVSPYAGLLYDINANYTVYASYSDIFKPQSNLMVDGGTIDPVIGKNYEAGIKGEFMNGRLNASAAVFRLEQTNLAEVDSNAGATACNGGYCYTAAGLVVSNGIDLSLNGELAAGWQVGAGYTYVNSEYGNGVDKGKTYSTYLPKHILQLYTTYHIPETEWTVGGNIRFQSKTYMEGSGFRIHQGGYATVGLLAKYQFNKKAELSVAVNNLFDRRYYTIGQYSSTSLGYFYGTPRSFFANLRYSF